MKLWLVSFICLLIVGITAASCKKSNLETLDFENSLCSQDTISYSKHISVLIQKHCLPCHGASQQNAGIVLDNYADANNYAMSGLIYGCISYQQGYSPMPTDGPKLSNCSIQAFQKWTDQGAPNN